MSTQFFKDDEEFRSRLMTAFGARTEEELGRLLGYSGRQGVANWKQHGRSPKFDRIFSCLPPSVSVDWLVTGRGRMDSGRSNEYVYVPMYAVSASAGGGNLVESEVPEGSIAFRSEWISRAIPCSPGDLFAMRVDGDSMAPTLADGSTILVCRSSTRMSEGGVYVLTIGDDLLVKRYRIVPDGRRCAVADNPAYGPIPLPDADAYRVHGRVVWTARCL